MQKTVKHTKTDAIWLFDYPSLASLDSGQDRIVFLSERDYNIIYQGLKDAHRYQSRVFLSFVGDKYLTVDDTQFVSWQNWLAELFNNLGDYRMTNGILENMLAALEALVAKGCCPESPGGGSFGAGEFEASPTETTSTPEDREGPPPPGNASWAEFDEKKCNMAHKILDDLITDIATTFVVGAGITAISTLAGLLVAALLTPIGWAALITLAGLAISLFATGISVATITTLLESNRDELVCGILDGDNVADSISGFGNVVSTIVEEDPTISAAGDVAVFITTNYIKSYASVDSFNRLYNAPPYEIPQDRDCSACVEEFPSSCRLMEEAGAGEIVTETVIETNAIQLVDGNYWWALGWTEDFEMTFSLEGGTLTSAVEWPTGVQTIKEENGTFCGTGNTSAWTREHSTFSESVVSGPSTTVQFYSDTAFRMRATITG